MRRDVKGAVLATMMGLVLPVTAEAVEGQCLPWKSAASVIAQNALLPGDKVYKLVQARTGGQIIHASLCDEGGRFLYKLVVLGPKGDVSNVTVDARTGQP